MNRWSTPFLAIGLVLTMTQGPAFSQTLQLTPIATHHTGLFDLGGAESTAFDAASKRLFFINAQANQLSILDLSKPESPVLVDSIRLTTFGDRPTQVVAANGRVAVSVVAFPPTDPGKVVLFDATGKLLSQYPVGAAPSALAFTPDGKKLLVANEGEPSDDYSTDPEGSVSIITLENGMVQTVAFTSFNTQAAALRSRGVRLFGSNATVAQDLEPESLGIAPNGKKAFVTLQENNAVAVLDIASAQITDIQPLGVKDHSLGTPLLSGASFDQRVALPVLGTPVYKDSLPPIRLGGFSGLCFDPAASNDSVYVFYTLPDQGPTADPIPISRAFGAGNEQAFVELRPYLLPEYQARIQRFSYYKNTARITLDSQILLTRNQNNQRTPITGRSNLIGFDEIPVTYTRQGTPYTVVDWVDTLTKAAYTELPFDPYGGDMEGIVRDRDGFFWLCDEIRPSLYKFRPDGVLAARYVPRGTSALGLIDVGSGSYGDEILPAVYRRRGPGRGFEAIAYDSDEHIIYAFLQSPLLNPNANATRDKSDIIRILGINPANGLPVREYVYLLENNSTYTPDQASSRVDKITDAVYRGKGTFLIVEADSSPAGQSTGKKSVFEINLRGATNLLADANLNKLSAKETSANASDKTLDMMTAQDLTAAGIRPVSKRKLLNLPSIGYAHASPEGIAWLPGTTLAVLNDNAYAGNSAPSVLGIVSFANNGGLDASDRDNKINIANWPVLGMYQPDGIASFQWAGKTYLLMANEGDARSYSAFEEESRVGAASYTLDATAFPDAATLKQEANLGRLRASNASGDTDGDGDFDLIYAFGGRSFSVRDTFGNLVFDSGNAFEAIVRDHPSFSPYFNTSNTNNAATEKDSRSDDKGPEPNVVCVATIDQKPYALIGLERIGGIMAFDLSKPENPTFAGYFNNRNFAAAANSRLAGDLGIEDILFIPESQSPNGTALVVTANAVSGTVTIFTTRQTATSTREALDANPWQLYPNPANDLLWVSQPGDYQVFNALGQLMLQVRQTDRITVDRLPKGTYLLRALDGSGTRRFVVNR